MMIFTFVCLFNYKITDAANNKICVNSMTYEITEFGSKVNIYEIDAAMLKKGNVYSGDLASLPKQEQKNYTFQATNLGSKCFTTKNPDGNGYITNSCPTIKQSYLSSSPYSVNKLAKLMQENTRMDRNGLTITIRDNDELNGKLVIRKIEASNRLNNTGVGLSFGLNYPGGILSTELYYLTRGSAINIHLASGKPTYFEFYLTEDGSIECGGAYLGNYQITAPYMTEMDNPWKNSNICQDFKSDKYSYIPYRSSYIPECYNDKIHVSENISETSIQAKINSYVNIFKQAYESGSDALMCQLTGNTKKYTTSYTKTIDGVSYWGANCTETMTITYEEPKKVSAGTGFTYDTTVEIERVCTPLKLRDVPQRPPCPPGPSKTVICTNPSTGEQQNHAGPNDDFDECVYRCDGGKYSQSCVNQCYQKVYENVNSEKTETNEKVYGRNFSDIISVSKSPKATPILDIDQGNRLDYCVPYNSSNPFSFSNPNCNVDGVSFVMTNGCAIDGWVCSTTPAYDPNSCGGEDPNERAKFNSDKVAIESWIRTYTTSEDFTVAVDDSYKPKGEKTLTVSNSMHASDIPNGMLSVSGGIGSTSVSGETVTVRKNYTIRLPKAVINPENADVTYKENTYRLKNNEQDGGNQYYTDFLSSPINDWRIREWNSNYIPDKYNIHVTLNNLGTNISGDDYTWSMIRIDCFYGLVNKYICVEGDPECPDPDCPPGTICPTPTLTPPTSRPPGEPDDPNDPDNPDNPGFPTCPPTDVCTGGQKYMFREVNLNDLFPDRNPRWNWSYQASGEVDPATIIQKIESTGNSAYDNAHLEYEIVLTRQNIRNIRSQNKRLGNYLNYDLGSCTLVRGKKICKSELLTNTSYVSSFSKLGTPGTK